MISVADRFAIEAMLWDSEVRKADRALVKRLLAEHDKLAREVNKLLERKYKCATKSTSKATITSATTIP